MLSQTQRIALLAAILAVGLSVVAALVVFAPAVQADASCEGVGVWSIVAGGRELANTARTLWRCSAQYREQNPTWAIATFATLFITLQAFAISGPMVLGESRVTCGDAPGAEAALTRTAPLLLCIQRLLLGPCGGRRTRSSS
jgi:hypothetical protein